MDELEEVIAKPHWYWVCPNGDCLHENAIEDDFEEMIVAECELCGTQAKVVKE